MAQYIRFRLNAAKIGVSMALLALIAGAADKAKANTTAPSASASSVGGFLKLTGLSKTVSSDFLKLEQKFLKLNTALSGFEAKLLKFERSVSTQYYKSKLIDTTFLKIDAANATFLKISDANLKYLKIDGTAANASELGGLKPDAFVQGRGGVVTGAVSVTDSASHVLMGDGSVRVLVGLFQPAAGGPVQKQVTLENDTNAVLNFTLNGGTSSGGAATIKPGSTQLLLPAVQSVDNGQGGQLDIQLFGSGGGAGKVWTITVSALGGAGGNTFVGQMLIGNL